MALSLASFELGGHAMSPPSHNREKSCPTNERRAWHERACALKVRERVVVEGPIGRLSGGLCVESLAHQEAHLLDQLHLVYLYMYMTKDLQNDGEKEVCAAARSLLRACACG